MCVRGDTGTELAIGKYTTRRNAAMSFLERLRKLLNSVLKARTEVCSVKISENPDLENRVCRLPNETLQLLGIEPGDQVILSSPMARPITVKALPVSDDTEKRTEKMERKAKEEDSGTFVPSNCTDTHNLKELHATDDIPSIHLDLRKRRGLQNDSNNYGLCKPVRIL